MKVNFVTQTKQVDFFIVKVGVQKSWDFCTLFFYLLFSYLQFTIYYLALGICYLAIYNLLLVMRKCFHNILRGRFSPWEFLLLLCERLFSYGGTEHTEFLGLVVFHFSVNSFPREEFYFDILYFYSLYTAKDLLTLLRNRLEGYG